MAAEDPDVKVLSSMCSSTHTQYIYNLLLADNCHLYILYWIVQNFLKTKKEGGYRVLKKLRRAWTGAWRRAPGDQKEKEEKKMLEFEYKLIKIKKKMKWKREAANGGSSKVVYEGTTLITHTCLIWKEVVIVTQTSSTTQLKIFPGWRRGESRGGICRQIFHYFFCMCECVHACEHLCTCVWTPEETLAVVPKECCHLVFSVSHWPRICQRGLSSWPASSKSSPAPAPASPSTGITSARHRSSFLICSLNGSDEKLEGQGMVE